MKTYSAKASEIEKKWVVIDAEGLVVGRLASIIAHAPARQAQADLHARTWIAATMSSSSTPPRCVLTGQKLKKKIYYHHTGYIGGIKERTAGAIMAGKFPERIVEKAVERMLPRGPLGPAPAVQFARLCGRRASP